MYTKIFYDLQALQQEILLLKQEWKRIVRTNGCFDLLHPGHLKTFEESKKFWDVLIVGVNGDNSPYRKEKPGRPINDEEFRTKMLEAIRFIDYIYIYNDETPLLPLQILLPDVLVKWGDYQVEDIIWYKEITENGWQVVTIPVVSNYSTSNMIAKILDVYK